MPFTLDDIIFLTVATVFAVGAGLFFAPVTKWLERGKRAKKE